MSYFSSFGEIETGFFQNAIIWKYISLVTLFENPNGACIIKLKFFYNQSRQRYLQKLPVSGLMYNY